jgi:hypothetical protein
MNMGLAHLSIDQLVQRFVTIAAAQGKAADLDDNAEYNRLFDKMQAIRQEFSARGDQKRALLPLLAHRSAQVRFLAAITTMSVDADAARRALQLIWDRKEYPQAADAYEFLHPSNDGSVDQT